MLVGKTGTGETINFSEDFTVAKILFPKLDSQFDITNDLINSGNPLVIQESQNEITPVKNYAGKVFFNHSTDNSGTGTINVIKGSQTDRCFLASYNAVNYTPGGSNKAWFNIYCYNSATVDNNGNPTQWAMASGCYFVKLAPFQMTATNAQGEQWNLTAKHIKRIGGRTDNSSFQENIPSDTNTATPLNSMWRNAPTTTDHPAVPTFNNSHAISGSKTWKREAQRQYPSDNINSNPDYYEDLPLPRSANAWDVHSKAEWAKQHGYPYNPSDLPTSDDDIDYSNYPTPTKDWDVHKSARWAKKHGYPYNSNDL